MDRGFSVSGNAGRKCELHLPAAFRGGDARPAGFEPSRGIVRHAKQVRRLVVESERLKRCGKGPRFTLQDPVRFVTHRLRERGSQGMLEQLPDDDLVPMQQRRTESVEESEHVKPPHLL